MEACNDAAARSDVSSECKLLPTAYEWQLKDAVQVLETAAAQRLHLQCHQKRVPLSCLLHICTIRITCSTPRSNSCLFFDLFLDHRSSLRP